MRPNCGSALACLQRVQVRHTQGPAGRLEVGKEGEPPPASQPATQPGRSQGCRLMAAQLVVCTWQPAPLVLCKALTTAIQRRVTPACDVWYQTPGGWPTLADSGRHAGGGAPCSRWISRACASSWSRNPFFSMSAGRQVAAWHGAPDQARVQPSPCRWRWQDGLHDTRPPNCLQAPPHLLQRRSLAVGCHGRRRMAR